MAHRLVWKSRFDDKVSIFERESSKIPGDWRSDSLGDRIVIRGPGQLRTYLVREWLSKRECRATLENIVYTDTEKVVKYENS